MQLNAKKYTSDDIQEIKGKNKMTCTIGSRAQVIHGTALKTAGGLKKGDLKLNAAGAIVSKRQSSRAKLLESPMLKLWRDSVKTAYKNPKYCGRFVPIRKGTAFYNEIKKDYQKRLAKTSSCPSKKKRKSKSKSRSKSK